ncbi:hypothetical protein Tco_1301209 [Tanacetum coccineum]
MNIDDKVRGLFVLSIQYVQQSALSLMFLGSNNVCCYVDKFDRIADDVCTTIFEKDEPEIAQPKKAEAETAELEIAEPETAEPVKLDVIEIGSSSSKLECSCTSELECSSTSELECSSTSESELSSYVSSYDESSSSDESRCLEKSVPGSMKMTVSQKGPFVYAILHIPFTLYNEPK